MHISFFHGYPPGRKLLKFLLVIISIPVLFLGVAFLYFHFNKDQFKSALLQYVQEHQEGVLSIEGIHFSPLTHLPHLAVRLNRVVYYEHVPEKRSAEEPPILDIDRAYLAFNLFSLLAGRYEVRRISLRDGEVNLLFYPDNSVNLLNALGLNRRLKSELMSYKDEALPDIDLILEEVTMKNLKGRFVHQGIALESEIDIQSLSAGLRYGEGVDDIRLAADLEFQYLLVDQKTYLQEKDIQLDLDVVLDEHTMVGRIRKSRFIFEGLAFAMAGTYSFRESGWADLTLDASDEDLTLLSYLFEDHILGRNLDLPHRGNLYLRGTIKGKTINHIPEIAFRFGADDFNLDIPGQDKSIDNLGFSGYFSTGKADNFSETILRIDHLRGNLPGGQISGALEIFNFTDPILTASCRLNADIQGWDQVFKLGRLDSLSGFIALSLDVENWRLAGGHTPERFNDARLELQNVFFHLPGFPHRFEQINGVLSGKADRMNLEGFVLRYGSSQISLAGRLENAAACLAGLDAGLKARLQLNSDNVKLREWPFFNTLSAGIAQEQVTGIFLDLSLENLEQRRGQSPLTKVKKIAVHEFHGDFERLPDIEAFRATATLKQTAKGGVEIGIDRLNSLLSVGKVNLKGGTLSFRDGAVFADTYLSLRGLQPARLANLISKNKPLILSSKPNGQLDAALHLKGSYDMTSRTIDTLSIAGGKAKYHNADAEGIVLESIDLQVKKAVFQERQDVSSLLSSLSASLVIGRFQAGQMKEMSIKCEVTGREDYYYFQGSLHQFSDVFEEGFIEIDLSGKSPVIHLAYELENYPMESILERFHRAPLLKGPVDISIDLTTEGTKEEALIHNATGSLIVKGKDLVFYGMDLEKQLTRLRNAKPFRLVNVGAYFLAGPFGAFVTEGMDASRIFDFKVAKGKKTQVSRLMSAWEFRNGRVETSDAALVTASNRIAVDACIDLRADSFERFTVAVVDRQGCSLAHQTVSGAFDNPQAGEVEVRDILPGPPANPFELVTDPKCKVFYTGSLAHPSIKN